MLLVVAAGGAVGACLRATVGEVVPTSAGAFPWSTFWINVSGTALLALLPALPLVRRHRLLPPLLGTGVLGGFTTLSAWSQESYDLAVSGAVGLGVGYALGTLIACLATVAVIDRLVARRGQG